MLQQLNENTALFRERLTEAGFNTGPGGRGRASQLFCSYSTSTCLFAHSTSLYEVNA